MIGSLTRNPMRFDVITLLPGMFAALTEHGVVGRALTRQLWSLQCWNPRDYASDAYRTIDDRPFGGGPGMVMMAEPLQRTIDAVREAQRSLGTGRSNVIYLSPQGQPLTQAMTAGWAAGTGLTLLCGRYEGVDQRLLDASVDSEVSIGDFVVSGGELPAMLLIDAIVRQLPGTLNHQQSVLEDSFVQGLLDHPHYTRPESTTAGVVPPVLLSGHHLDIIRWRREQALVATARKRPDLLRNAQQCRLLSAADIDFLNRSGLGSVLN